MPRALPPGQLALAVGFGLLPLACGARFAPEGTSRGGPELPLRTPTLATASTPRVAAQETPLASAAPSTLSPLPLAMALPEVLPSSSTPEASTQSGAENAGAPSQAPATSFSAAPPDLPRVPLPSAFLDCSETLAEPAKESSCSSSLSCGGRLADTLIQCSKDIDGRWRCKCEHSNSNLTDVIVPQALATDVCHLGLGACAPNAPAPGEQTCAPPSISTKFATCYLSLDCTHPLRLTDPAPWDLEVPDPPLTVSCAIGNGAPVPQEPDAKTLCACSDGRLLSPLPSESSLCLGGLEACLAPAIDAGFQDSSTP